MKRKILNKTTFVEKDAKNAPVKDITWEATQAQTDGEQIADWGSGKPTILRRFEFKFPPGFKGKPKKKDILTEGYIKHLENRLWADELEMVVEPKVAFTEGGFSVFATCQAKRGSLIPRYAQDQLIPLQDKLQRKL